MGDSARVEFFDIALPEVQAAYKELIESVEAHHLRYPLVAINGEFRHSGAISYRAILTELRRLVVPETEAGVP